MSSISVLENKGTTIKFLLKLGEDFFTVDVGHSLADGKTINPKLAFRININLYKIYDTRQSLHYKDNKIYVPMWGGTGNQNQNVVFVYGNIESAISSAKTKEKGFPDERPNEVWKFAGPAGESFEIEGVSFFGNALWFNTTATAFKKRIKSCKNSQNML